MYLDAENQYGDAQALAASAASTNVIDHGIARKLGSGEPMVVMLSLDAAADDGDANETYSAQLETDDAEAFSSPASVGPAVSIPAGSPAGSKFYIDLPIGTPIEQFTRVNYTLGGTTPSVTISAHLVPRSFVEDREDYASGFTVA